MKNQSLNDENNELRDAPLLQSLRSIDPYKAPEGYFDTLSADIQNKISSKKVPGFHLVKLWKPVFAMAGVVIVALLIKFYNNQNNPADKMPITEIHESFSYEDLLESNYYLEIDEDLIAESAEETGVSSIEYEASDDKEIEEYLIQTIDENTLTNEL